MKSVGLFISIILLIGTSALGQQQQQQTFPETQNPNTELPFPSKPNALIICAGDVPPDDMVITATGTSVTCAGSCRSRQIEPVDGPVMVICADQPIPKFYETQSVTTLPACNCIADQDNAYVIRRGIGAPTPTPAAPRFPAPNSKVSRKTVCLKFRRAANPERKSSCMNASRRENYWRSGKRARSPLCSASGKYSTLCCLAAIACQLPDSTTFPRSSTYTISARLMVEKRCAMISMVRSP